MRRSRSISPLASALAMVFVCCVSPEASAQCDGAHGREHSGYFSRHRVHGLRYSGDYYTRPRHSRLSFSRERSLGQRGYLGLYPGPPDSPHRGRISNDYAAYPSRSRSRWHRVPANEVPQLENLPDGGSGAPAVGGPRRVVPPNIIIDPEPRREPRRELPMADAKRDTGWTLLARGETVRALGRFAGRIAIAGSDAEARVGYALAAALYGDDGAAESSMQLALKIDPSVLSAVEIDEALSERLAGLTERYAETGDGALVMSDALDDMLADGGPARAETPVLAAK